MFGHRAYLGINPEIEKMTQAEEQVKTFPLFKRGPMLFLTYFPPQKSAKKLAFLLKANLNFKKLIIALVFEKNANFFAENCRKSQKIVTITSGPSQEAFTRCRTRRHLPPRDQS
jgi:hypothetical protein